MRLFFCAAAALIALAAIPLLARRGQKLGKKRAYLMTFCSALFFTSVFMGSGAFFAKLEKSWPSGLYSAEITASAPAAFLMTGGDVTLEVKNIGSLTWDSAAKNEPVFLSWHVLGEKGGMIRFDNPRISFPRPIPPGDSISVAIQVSPASEGIPAGRYILEFDLVCENVAWFADRGSATRRVPIEVLP
jgi:hypothetical protein